METTKFAPVVVFAYKRLDKLKLCLRSLERCKDAEQTDLIFFGDGYKGETDKESVLAVQNFIRQYSEDNRYFHKIRFYLKERNEGLAASIISGVTDILNDYGRVIVVEDDLLVSDDFLSYMNEALAYYAEEKRVGTIGGFTPISSKIQVNPGGILKSRMGCCLGWATWYDRWQQIDWNITNNLSLTEEEKSRIDSVQYGFCAMLEQQAKGIIDSWAVRYDYHGITNKWWTIYPNLSKVANIGFDASSTHAKDEHDKRKKVTAKSSECRMCALKDAVDVSVPMRAYFKPSIWEKIRYFVAVRRHR